MDNALVNLLGAPTKSNASLVLPPSSHPFGLFGSAVFGPGLPGELGTESSDDLITPANAEVPFNGAQLPLPAAASLPPPRQQQCLFCAGLGSQGVCGPLRPVTIDGEAAAVHQLCAIWAPGCYLPQVRPGDGPRQLAVVAGVVPALVRRSSWLLNLFPPILARLAGLVVLCQPGCGGKACPAALVHRLRPARSRHHLRTLGVRVPAALACSKCRCQLLVSSVVQPGLVTPPCNVQPPSLLTIRIPVAATAAGAVVRTTCRVHWRPPTFCWRTRATSCGAHTTRTRTTATRITPSPCLGHAGRQVRWWKGGEPHSTQGCSPSCRC
jgi:hypothetical protein